MFSTQHHQANTVTTMAEIVALQRLIDSMPADDDPPAPPAVPITDVANAAFQQRETSLATREAALLAQMTEMMTLLRTAGPANTNQQSNNSRNNRGRGAGRTNNRNGGGRGQGTAPSVRAYCWTHGWCAHASDKCDNQAPGHQITATSTNMQGGSTNKCFWITT